MGPMSNNEGKQSLPASFKIITHLASVLIPGILFGLAVAPAMELPFFVPVLMYTFSFFLFYWLAGGLEWKNEKIHGLRIALFLFFGVVILSVILAGFWLLIRFILAKLYRVPMSAATGRLLNMREWFVKTVGPKPPRQPINIWRSLRSLRILYLFLIAVGIGLVWLIIGVSSMASYDFSAPANASQTIINYVISFLMLFLLVLGVLKARDYSNEKQQAKKPQVVRPHYPVPAPAHAPAISTPAGADYSLVRGPNKEVVGFWLRDPAFAKNEAGLVMLMIKAGLPKEVQTKVATGRYWITPNTADSRGGSIVRWDSAPAPTAKPSTPPEGVKPLVQPVPPAIPPASVVDPRVFRLADPNHPARKYIDEASAFLDRSVKIQVFGQQILYQNEGAFEAVQIAARLDEGIALCPEDLDLQVAKAGILQAGMQYKSAEDLLDTVLAKDSAHFEARQWKDHWATWNSAWKYPSWDEKQKTLHPMMANNLSRNQALQVVRDGLQKTLAIVIKGPAYSMQENTRVQVNWILSETPYGPLVAYYVSTTEPGDAKPHDAEIFLVPQKPSEFTPTESYFLIQQLAFTPYCFIVLANESKVSFCSRYVFGEKETRVIKEIAGKMAARDAFIPISQIRAASQWHMDHFDMDTMRFK